MVREEVAGSTQTLQWKCVESRVDSKRLYYGRFILSPLRKGQADTVGIALRRALLGEIEGTCITRAKFGSVPHEYLNPKFFLPPFFFMYFSDQEKYKIMSVILKLF